MRFLVITFLFVSVFQACSSETFVSPNQSGLYFQGRIGQNQLEYYELYWPGTSVTLKTTSTKVSVVLSDDIGQTYYSVIIDGKLDTIINPTKARQSYQLANNLSKGEHTIELFRRTEYPTGTTRFYGFEIEGDAQILPIDEPEMQVVFIGNSITTGYANEDKSGLDRPTGLFTNNYNAYGAVAARFFNANYQCIARGGIGFMVSWYPLIMPEIFNLTNPNDRENKWNPHNYSQRVVVINLGQNDSWILANPNQNAYKAAFGKKEITPSEILSTYKQFVSSVRNFYPNAHIICALGSMDAVQDNSPWFSYIQKAVEGLNDSHISTLKFPFLAKTTHPSVADHKLMANLLIGHIEEVVLR
jgi:lysophospholipase L1-like esterase